MTKPVSAATPGSIKVGDLVVVVRGNKCPHCHPVSLGKIFRVEELFTNENTSWFCPSCGMKNIEEKSPLDLVAVGSNGWRGSAKRLRRIPPAEELEGVQQKEDIREPA